MSVPLDAPVELVDMPPADADADATADPLEEARGADEPCASAPAARPRIARSAAILKVESEGIARA